MPEDAHDNGLIDVHCHVVPAALPQAPTAALAARWPCMRCDGGGAATLMLGDTPFRPLDERSWSVERRLADMSAAGVAVQVLSPMPELLSYWIDIAGTEALCDAVNAQIAEMVAAHPRRFRGLGAVPLQDPARAAVLVRGLRERFGLSGVEIGSNVAGMLLGDPKLDPFWAAAEEAGVAIFVHAIHPIGRAASPSPAFTNVVMFPLEIGMAAGALLMAGVPERFPGLRIALSHGGGALPAMLGRLDQGWLKGGRFGGAVVERPSETARRLFIDGNVYDAAHLHHLAGCAMPGQVFAGSDYPYRIMEDDVAGLIARAGLDAAAAMSVRNGAARRFLGES